MLLRTLQGTPRLSKLDLRGCLRLIELRLSHGALTELVLLSCPNLRRLFIDCARLTHLRFEQPFDNQRLFAEQPPLAWFHLTNLRSAAEFQTPFDQLTSLAIADSPFDGLVLPSVRRMLQLTPQLHSLSLSRCAGITDEFVPFLLPLCTGLIDLSFSRITGLAAPILHSRTLRSLHFHECESLTGTHFFEAGSAALAHFLIPFVQNPRLIAAR